MKKSLKKMESNTRKGSLWTTTLEDIDKFLPTDQEIEKAIQNIKDSNIDINKPIPEAEKLKKIFEPKN